MKAFEPLDLFGLEPEFSTEEKMVRSTVRSFVSDLVLPKIGEYYDQGIFPKELVFQFLNNCKLKVCVGLFLACIKPVLALPGV